MKVFIPQRKLYKCFGTHLLGQEVVWLVLWPNEALTYLQAPQEVSRTLKGSLQIKNNLEVPTLVYVQGYVQGLQKILQHLTLFQRSPSQVWRCPHISSPLQKLPYSSTQQLSVNVTKGLQKLPTSYINPWGGSFKASCDIRHQMLRTDQGYQ